MSASTVSPGTVINAPEIKYAWTTSGNYGSNNFTIEKLTTQTYGTVWRMYYAAGGNPFAMRVEGSPTAVENGMYYFLGDHLGSTSITMKFSIAGALTKQAEPALYAVGRKSPKRFCRDCDFNRYSLHRSEKR